MKARPRDPKWLRAIAIVTFALLAIGVSGYYATPWVFDWIENSAPPTIRQLYWDTVQATVSVESGEPESESGVSGSGFYFSPRLVLTNAHVTRGRHMVKVFDPENDDFGWDGVVLSEDTLRDVAIVYTASNWRHLDFREQPPDVGEPVYAIGSPHGYMGAFSSGIVSQTYEESDRSRTLVQFTNLVAPGSSGGPLLDRRGRVVGMTSQRYDFGFAIDVKTIKKALSEFRAHYAGSSKSPVEFDDVNAEVGEAAFAPFSLAEEDGRMREDALSHQYAELDFSSTFNFLIILGLVLALITVLLRRHQRLRWMALRRRLRASLEELRSTAFLPDQLIE